MSERYKKLTSHGAISIPVAMRRDIGLQGGDPMQVSQEGGRIIIESYVPRCVFCGNTENVKKFEGKPDVNGVELKYYVTDETVIPAGEQTGKVLVEAEQTGTAYNLPADKITVSMIHLDGVSSINNEENWLYEEGADIEDLESLRERCLEAWSELAERTTASKLKSVAKAVPGVLDVCFSFCRK